MSDLEPITQEETAWAEGNLEPITRKEQYLNRLTGEEQAIPDEPITRTEQYLAKLCGEEIEIPSSPITREETYLAYLNGENVTLPEPITRLEQFMAYAAEKSETKPTPLTREEFYWNKYQGGAVLKDFPGLPASIVTVTDALAKPLDSLKVAITPVQEGSGDPSPDNIRPISGWTGAKITKTAENLFGGDRWFGIGGTDDVEERTVTGGAQASSIPFLSNLGGYTFKENTIYTLIITMTTTATNGRPCLSFVYTDGTSEQLKNDSIGTTKGSYAFSSNPNKTIDYIGRASYSGTKKYYVDECGVFEGKLTAADFEPYTGQDYTIPFTDGTDPLTVYGGELDVETGVLTVDRSLIRINDYLSDIQMVSSGNKRYFRLDDISFAEYWRICDKFKNVAVSSSTTNIGIGMVLPSGKTRYNISIRPDNVSEISSISLFRDYINSLGDVYAVVKYGARTYQLTPTEVQMLLGTNNIWADTGDILEGKYYGKRSSATRAMLNTVRDTGEITPTEEPEEPEENDER